MPVDDFFSPDAPLLAAASDDDKMWMSPATVEQVRSLLLSPQRWISELNAMRPERTPEISLHPMFLLSMRMAPRIPTSATGKPLLVQGISETNFISIRPAEGLGVHVLDDWEDYWTFWENSEALDVMVNLTSNIGCGHMQITKSTDSRGVRADKIAAFLTWGANPNKTYKKTPTSPDIPYINKILSKTPNELTFVEEGNDPTAGEPDGPIFDEVSVSDLSGVTFTLTGVFDDSNPAVACENMIGHWGGASISLEDVVVKSY